MMNRKLRNILAAGSIVCMAAVMASCGAEEETQQVLAPVSEAETVSSEEAAEIASEEEVSSEEAAAIAQAEESSETISVEVPAEAESTSAENSAGTDAEAGGDAKSGAEYGYAGDDPAVAAVYRYLVEEIAKKNYAESDVMIPTVFIVDKESAGENEVLIYGDFWLDNGDINGENIDLMSGGSYTGVMHVKTEGENCEVTQFDWVADGEDWGEEAQKMFGDRFDALMEYYGDDTAKDDLRMSSIRDYVRLNHLPVTQFTDYGTKPIKLDQA